MDTLSKYLRKLIVRLLEGGTRGHLGPAMSIIEILRVLYDSFLNYNSKNPKNILSMLPIFWCVNIHRLNVFK